MQNYLFSLILYFVPYLFPYVPIELITRIGVNKTNIFVLFFPNTLSCFAKWEQKWEQQTITLKTGNNTRILDPPPPHEKFWRGDGNPTRTFVCEISQIGIYSGIVRIGGVSGGVA